MIQLAKYTRTLPAESFYVLQLAIFMSYTLYVYHNSMIVFMVWGDATPRTSFIYAPAWVMIVQRVLTHGKKTSRDTWTVSPSIFHVYIASWDSKSLAETGYRASWDNKKLAETRIFMYLITLWLHLYVCCSSQWRGLARSIPPKQTIKKMVISLWDTPNGKFLFNFSIAMSKIKI